MLTLPSAVKVYVATDPIDCRKSFDGLSTAVSAVLGADPTSGHLFVFFNRRGNQCRILFWDRTGYCVLAKRLARGSFHLAARATAQTHHIEVEAAELSLVLEGFDLANAKKHLRWRKAA